MSSNTNFRKFRDMQGYANHRPQMTWPGKSRVAVSFVLNLEEGAERCIADGDLLNEPIHEVVSQVSDVPDLCRASHFEFGTRVGYWRVMDEFTRHQARLTLNVCGRVALRSPELLKDAVARGHDLCGHGWLWQSPAGLGEHEERALMVRTCEAIEQACSVCVVGWHCKSSATANTAKLAKSLGLLYHSDAYNDELPYWVQTPEGPFLTLPYQFDTNDMRFFGEAPAFVRAEDFSGYVIDSLEQLALEAERDARSSMITIGLHARIIGRPGRFQGLVNILDYLRGRDIFWVATRQEIAQQWITFAAK
jgi:peptidoglycan/xylan/chitin deacetylase (PgdA/CDA1 family)